MIMIAKNSLAISLLVMAVNAFSQSSNSDFQDSVKARQEDERFTIVEEPAQPVGGMVAFYKYIKKNIKNPKSVKRGEVEGHVFVEFVVDKDGSIVNESVKCADESDFKEDVPRFSSLKDEECRQEAIRLVKEAPAWIPGKQKGKPVRQRVILPIRFKL